MLGANNANDARGLMDAHTSDMQLSRDAEPNNAEQWLEVSAWHIIVMTCSFQESKVLWDFVAHLVQAVSSERLMVARSSRSVADDGRWKMIEAVLNEVSLKRVGKCCGLLLENAVDGVGKKGEMDEPLLMLLASSQVPVTYAGGLILLDAFNLTSALGNNTQMSPGIE